ncbi:hypothetical protein V1511DRAFT_457024 [Dipodascopsis uninucleata]
MAFRLSCMNLLKAALVLVVLIVLFTPPDVHSALKSRIGMDNSADYAPDSPIDINSLFNDGRKLDLPPQQSSTYKSTQPASTGTVTPMVNDVPQQRGHKKIFLVNSPRYHFEIVLPFLNVFSNLKDVDVTLFAKPVGYSRFGVRPWLDLYANPLGLNLMHIDNITNFLGEEQAAPDLIFLTSCPEDVLEIYQSLDVFLARGSKVMCLVHEAQKWNLNEPDNNKSPYKPQISYMTNWIKKGQWELATLSNHVQNYVSKNFATYFRTGSEVTYNPPILYPVFRLPDSKINLDQVNPFVAIVGKLEPWRRDYNSIFRQYAMFDPAVDLHLVGYGVELEAPESIKHRLSYLLGADFPQYFEEISKAVAVIPSFASKDYLRSQASSSIATAVIVTTPPLLTREMLGAYSYIPEEAAWIQEDGETEVEAFSRVSKLGADAWTAKKKILAKARDDLMMKNLKQFEIELVELEKAKKIASKR